MPAALVSNPLSPLPVEKSSLKRSAQIMPLGLISHRNGTSNRPPTPNSGSKTFLSPSKLKQSLSRSDLKSSSPGPSNSKHASKIPTPRPLPSARSPTPEPLVQKSSIPRPGPPSPRTPTPTGTPGPSARPRVPSRTQLRHATAARRLSAEGKGKDILPDDYNFNTSLGPVADDDISWSGLRSTIKTPEQRDGGHGLKRKQAEQKPYKVAGTEKAPPYLMKSLEAAGVRTIADSANIETLVEHKDHLGALFLTPHSVVEQLHDRGHNCHVWIATMLAREEKPLQKYKVEEIVNLAFMKFLIELCSILVDCLKPGLPLYTFVDPRRLMHTDGMRSVADQAVALVNGLESRGIDRDRIYISIPATEPGLAVAKVLKERHGIKTNLVFVSGLIQAAACAAAGAAAITMPVDKILTCREEKIGVDYTRLNPHPGLQNIKATACYMKHHKPEIHVIGSSLRSLLEIEHCSVFNMVCLDDVQVRPTKWQRLRVNDPPNPTSDVTAMKALYPPKFAEDEHGFRYLSSMPSEVRNECAGILHDGLRSWQNEAERIADALRREINKFIPPPEPEPTGPPSPRSSVRPGSAQYELLRYFQSRNLRLPRKNAKSEPRVEFPSKEDWNDDELDDRMDQYERAESSEPPTVPQSPYWTDADEFENEPGSSSDEDDMKLF